MQTKVSQIIKQYQETPGALIPIFHAIQEEYGYLPEQALEQVATALKMPVSRAYGVATFYSMFSVKPRGRYVIRVCSSAPCHVNKAAGILQALEKELGIKLGESTPDGKFALEATECVGACQATPVITINGKPYGDLTPTKIASIIAEYR